MTRRAPLATRAPLVLWCAVVFVVPGTLLSVAFGGIGAIMLALLLVDYLVVNDDDEDVEQPRRFSLATQALIGAGAATAIGLAIAFGAWLDH